MLLRLSNTATLKVREVGCFAPTQQEGQPSGLTLSMVITSAIGIQKNCSNICHRETQGNTSVSSGALGMGGVGKGSPKNS